MARAQALNFVPGRLRTLAVSFLVAVSLSYPAIAEETGRTSIKDVAHLSEFAARVAELEEASTEFVVTAALSLLQQDNPNWTFPEAGKQWNETEKVFAQTYSSDVKAVLTNYEYNMAARRGALARNKGASEEQLSKALVVFELLQEMINSARDFHQYQSSGDADAANVIFKDHILVLAGEIRAKVVVLRDGIRTQIKLSGI